MAGYSGTPLAQKLGIKPGHRVLLSQAPRGFTKTLGALPEGAKVADAAASRGSFDVAVAFVTSSSELDKSLAKLKSRMDPAAGFWVAWPKRASGVATDVTEDVVRQKAIASGLVDNKVCAVDDTWSGLRLVYRLIDRPALAKKSRKGR
jgi:hypothetical protein